MLGEKDLERVQLLRDALDVVQTVDTDDELDALELFLQLRDTSLHRWLLEAFRKLLGVNSDGEGADGAQLPPVLDAVRCRRESSADVSIQENTRGARRLTISWSSN